MNFKHALTFSIWFVCILAIAAQTVPPLVNYQGRLANPDGSPLPTADYELRFRIYDSATNATNLIWGPQVFDGVAGAGHGLKIPVVQGYFNVMLGPVDTNGASLAGAFSGTNRFVEVTVSNRPPILPRQQILSAPFAFNSEKLAGYDWSALFGTNNPISGSIPFTKLAQRQVGTNVGVGGVAISSSSGSQLFAAGGAVTNLTNLMVTLVTSGRPVSVGLVSAPGGESSIYLSRNDDRVAVGSVLLFEDDILISEHQLRIDVGNAPSVNTKIPPSSIHTISVPSSGTHTYKVKCNPNQGNFEFSTIRLVAFEL